MKIYTKMTDFPIMLNLCFCENSTVKYKSFKTSSKYEGSIKVISKCIFLICLSADKIMLQIRN